MVGYHRILKASLDFTEEDLRLARHDHSVRAKLDENPLEYVLLSLVDLLETDSEGFQERERKKLRQEALRPHPANQSFSVDGTPSTPEDPLPRFPSSFETPNNKRKISDTSFGTQSTETTPGRMVQPEAKVQSLQDKFVTTIIKKVWWGQIDVPWAQGRHLFLTYTEFPPFSPVSC